MRSTPGTSARRRDLLAAELAATPEGNAARARAAQQLAADVVSVAEDVERVPAEAAEAAAQARRAVEESAGESELTLDRAKLGVDRVARESLGELDDLLVELLPALCSAEASLSAEQRVRLYEVAGRAMSDVPEFIAERLEHLEPGLPFSDGDVEPLVARRRVERARAEVERAEAAAREAAQQLEAVKAAGARARGRLLEHRVGSGLAPERGRRVMSLLDGDLAAADAAAEACSSAGEAAAAGMLAALAALDGRGVAGVAGPADDDDAGLEAR